MRQRLDAVPPMDKAQDTVTVRTVSILANMAFVVVGFNYSFFNALVTPLVRRSLTYQYGSEFADDNVGKFSSILASAINVCGAIANPIFGQLSDGSGRRNIMIVSLLSATACLTSFAALHTYWALLAVRIVTGLFDSTQFIAKVVIGDVAMPETQNHLFSQMYSWFAFCLMAGPFLVSLFEGAEAWQSSGPCLIAATVAFVSLVAAYFYLPETNPPGSRARSHVAWYQVLSTRRLALPIWAYGLLSMCLAPGEVCTALFITEQRGGLALSAVNIGRLFAIQGLAYWLTQALLSAALLRRFGTVVMFRFTLAAMTVLYPLTIVAVHVPMKFAVVAVVMSARVFASSIAISAINIIISEVGSRADALGSVMAVAQSLCGLSKTLSLFAIGVLYDLLAMHHAVYALFLLFSGALALLFVFSFFIRRPDNVSEEVRQTQMRDLSMPTSPTVLQM